MNKLRGKLLAAFIITEFILVAVMFSPVITVTGQATPIISIVDPQTGSSTISLGSETEPLPPGGYPFTVNVILDGSVDELVTYQIAVAFNKTKVRCTAAWIPKNDPDYIFYDKEIQTAVCNITQANIDGYVYLGASLFAPETVTVSQGLFCKINFTAIKTGTSTLKIIPTGGGEEKYDDDTFLWNPKFIEMPFNPGSFSVTVTAVRSPPVASFTFSPLNPKANQTITFDASGSYDPDGEIVSYDWDFGDGTNTTRYPPNATVTHVFTQNGNYNVTLEVFDNEGFHNSTVKTVLVGRSPNVSFTYDWERKDEYPSNPYKNIVVTFNASLCSDPDGYITQYDWDFGDSTNATEYPPNATVTHVFTQNGIYNITLKVFDNDGLYNSTMRQIFVGIRPYVMFTYDPENPDPNETITFDASGSGDFDGNIVLYVWEFGDTYPPELLEVDATDPTNPTPAMVIHSYIGGGLYPVTLQVYDNDGLYNSTVQIINVTLIAHRAAAGTHPIVYVGAAVIIIMIAVAIWYKRRPEKELGRKERYRVV